jgi:hypothetical protein
MIVEEIRHYASHHQFYVQDSEPVGSSGDPTFWTKTSSENRMAIGDGILAFGTGSYDVVRIRVEYHQEVPNLELDLWDHVVEAGLEIRSSYLIVFGCIQSSGLFFRLRPDHYRVRCCMADLLLATDSTGDAGDWYQVQFWPAEPADPKIIKRWIAPEGFLPRMTKLR